MRTAAPATGRANRSPGRTVAKNRPAFPTTRAVRVARAFRRRSAAPAVQRNRMSQCYIHISSIANHAKINRQPSRLETIVSRTKQTPAPQFNRQQIATSRITNRSSRTTSGPRFAAALLDTNGRFRRNNNSRNSFKTNDRANSYSIQIESLLATKRKPARAQLDRHQRISSSQRLISNRNTTSFKIPAKPMKINPKLKSNRNKNTISPFPTHRESQSTNHYSLITTHTPLRPMLHCYIRNLIVTPDRSPLKINRKPCRLEIRISQRKQTPATPINRKQSDTSRITNLPHRQTGRAVCVLCDSHSRRPCTSWRDSLKMLGLR